MAGDVDICNLALAHLGDSATVTSLDPPEGSAQAEHCARFYPIARNALLALHAWGFATTRAPLAPLGSSPSPWWSHAYALPQDTLSVLAILAPDAGDDYLQAGQATPQPFSCEVDATGQRIVLTNQPGALLRYTRVELDAGRFPPLFTLTLSWQLAGMLAGPLIKGEAGAAEAKRCAQMAQAYLAQATRHDASQQRAVLEPVADWIQGR